MADPGPAPLTARQAGLILCLCCHKVVPRAMEGSPCPRCGARLHSRRPDSIARSWALVITSAVLMFPANILPIMEVNYLGRLDASTIMDGILYFFREGSYGIGGVILTASILVPCFKIIGIALVLLSVQFRWRSWLRHKTAMFRFIEFIGRWSMLDIFVIAILQVLVDFGLLSTITAGPAANYFTAVVVVTMFAAQAFDTRLLWDAAEEV